MLAGCAAPPSSVTATGSAHLLTQAPQFSAGQQWTYKRIDLWKKEEVERFSQTFNTQTHPTWSVAWGILSSSDKTRLGTTTEQFDANTHGFADPRMTGHYAPLKFPLAPGKTWTFSYNFQSKPDTLIEVTQTAQVTRWEDVTVPAGNFKTLRVEHVGNYKATQGVQSWRGRITETFWYAPEVGRVVAQEYKDTNGRGTTWDQRRDELVAMRQ
ncbi:MAG: hypothetical protein FD135_3506 [Comamonadaceae bacterium]|nr:MAG: hypothetical protein FD135_3506 [Comamonadaceae bacterium]